MTKNLLVLVLILAGSAAFAESDCSKSTDACAAGTKKLSPFVEASLRESVPPHMEAKKAEAPALAASTAAALPAGTPAGSEGQYSSSSMLLSGDESGGRLSSPAWLLLVIAGFAGLYFYLRGGEKKRRRK